MDGILFYKWSSSYKQKLANKNLQRQEKDPYVKRLHIKSGRSVFCPYLYALFFSEKDNTIVVIVAWDPEDTQKY